MRPRALLVVVLFVLAGCSGVFGGSSQPAETLTPAAVPTDRPTPTPVPQLVPGVTGDGIENANALVVAHVSFLDNRSFTEKSNSTVLAPNGSILLHTTSTLRAGPSGEFYSVIERNGSYLSRDRATLSGHSEAWWDGQRYVVKRTFQNGTTTYSQPPVGATRSDVALGTLPYLLESFSTNNTAVSERFIRNGTTLYRVRGVTRSGTTGNMTIQLLVNSRGFIHQYTMVRRLSSETDGSKTVAKTRFVGINATDTPERPSWVGAAMNRTTAVARGGSETPK